MISLITVLLLRSDGIFFEVSKKAFSTLFGVEGAGLLREKLVIGRPRRCESAEEDPGPPAESEYLQRKYTGKFNRAKCNRFPLLSPILQIAFRYG
jgi:hypothetical protein